MIVRDAHKVKNFLAPCFPSVRRRPPLSLPSRSPRRRPSLPRPPRPAPERRQGQGGDLKGSCQAQARRQARPGVPAGPPSAVDSQGPEAHRLRRGCPPVQEGEAAARPGRQPHRQRHRLARRLQRGCRRESRRRVRGPRRPVCVRRHPGRPPSPFSTCSWISFRKLWPASSACKRMPPYTSKPPRVS